jgi:hypothetical protein
MVTNDANINMHTNLPTIAKYTLNTLLRMVPNARPSATTSAFRIRSSLSAASFSAFNRCSASSLAVGVSFDDVGDVDDNDDNDDNDDDDDVNLVLLSLDNNVDMLLDDFGRLLGGLTPNAISICSRAPTLSIHPHAIGLVIIIFPLESLDHEYM